MNPVFADAFYFLALLSPKDAAHQRALDFTRNYTGRMFTTTWVLTEVADALAKPTQRSIVGQFLEELSAKKAMRIVATSDALFQAGVVLYRSRPDKEWSLTDCISFVVMQQEGITEALTGDHHFE